MIVEKFTPLPPIPHTYPELLPFKALCELTNRPGPEVDQMLAENLGAVEELDFKGHLTPRLATQLLADTELQLLLHACMRWVQSETGWVFCRRLNMVADVHNCKRQDMEGAVAEAHLQFARELCDLTAEYYVRRRI